MKISQMQQILEICRCGSINKAAQNLYISQSSLSASIQAAENELGFPILQRTHSGIALTEEGKRFKDTAEKITALYGDFLKHPLGTPGEGLKISSQFLRYAMSIFSVMSSEAGTMSSEYKFHECDSVDVISDLLKKRSDLGIVVTPSISREKVLSLTDSMGLESHILGTDEGACIVGPNNPLYYSEEDCVSIKQLAEFPRVSYERKEWVSGINLFAEEYESFPYSGFVSISDSGSFQNIMENTNCYFIGVHNKTAYESVPFYKGMRCLRISDMDFPADTIWLYRKNSELTPKTREYLRRLYKAAGEKPIDMLL